MATPPCRRSSKVELKFPKPKGPKHISLMEAIDGDEEQSALMKSIMKSVPDLKMEHGVRIPDSTVCWATYLTHRHFSETLSGRELEEMAVDILTSGCLLVKSEINNHADEKWMDELEYVFCRYIVESNELLRENPEPEQWLIRVAKEFDEARTVLSKLVSEQKPVLLQSLEGEEACYRHTQESLHKRLALTPGDISSACWTGDYLKCYHKLRKLDALAAEIENIQMQPDDDVMTLDRRHIGQVVSRLIGIPLPLLPTYGSTELSCLSSHISERVVCQDDAIRHIQESIFTNALLHPDRVKRPRASLLFLGPSAVGKTEVAKCITEVFFSSLDNLIHIDMSKYGELKQEYSGLQWLAETISKNPYSLILFKKIDKSHLDTMRTLLLDLVCGNLSDNGQHVNLSNVIVILTSNVGAEKLTSPSSIDQNPKCPEKTVHDHVLEEATTIFGADLLNALDGTVVFDSLARGVENATRHILRKRVQEISLNKLIASPSKHVLDLVSSNYFRQPDKGANAIEPWLEETVIPHLWSIVENMASKHHIPPYTVYIDTLVGTEELSFRLDETDLAEKWMYQHFNQSFRKSRSLYQKRNEIFELRNCLSSLPVPDPGDESNPETVIFLQKAMHASEICNKIIQPDEDLNKEIWHLEPKNTICVHASQCVLCENLKPRLLQLKKSNQNQAVNVFIDAVLESIDEPLGLDKKSPTSFLLMGLTSSTRSEFVNDLTNHFKMTEPGSSLLVRVDMSNEDSQSHLFCNSGSHESYALSMMEAVRICPHSILLFDLIEKANDSVLGTLLNILDTGMLNDGPSSMVDLRKTTIIVTTDLGNKDMISKFFGCSNPSTSKNTDAKEVQQRFRSEMVYRMNEIVLFDPLAQEKMNIVRLPLKREGALLQLDLRKSRKLIHSLFGNNAALLEDSDLQMIEESMDSDWVYTIDHDEDESRKKGRGLINSLFSKHF